MDKKVRRVNLPVLTRKFVSRDFRMARARYLPLFNVLTTIDFDDIDHSFIEDILRLSGVTIAELTSRSGEVTQLLISSAKKMPSMKPLPFLPAYLDLQIAVTINFLCLAPWNGSRFIDALLSDRITYENGANKTYPVTTLYPKFSVELFSTALDNFQQNLRRPMVVRIDKDLLSSAEALTSQFLKLLVIPKEWCRVLRTEDIIVNLLANLFDALRTGVSQNKEDRVSSCGNVKLPFILDATSSLNVVTELTFYKAMHQFTEVQEKIFTISADDWADLKSKTCHEYFSENFMLKYFDKVYSQLVTKAATIAADFKRQIKCLKDMTKYLEYALIGEGYEISSLTLDQKILLSAFLNTDKPLSLQVAPDVAASGLQHLTSAHVTALQSIVDCIKANFNVGDSPILSNFKGCCVMHHGRAIIVKLEDALLTPDTRRILRITGSKKNGGVRHVDDILYNSNTINFNLFTGLPSDPSASNIHQIDVRAYMPGNFKMRSSVVNKYGVSFVLKGSISEMEIRTFAKRNATFLLVNSDIENQRCLITPKCELATIFPPSEGVDYPSFGSTNRRGVSGLEFKYEMIDPTTCDFVDLVLSTPLSLIINQPQQKLKELYLARIKSFFNDAYSFGVPKKKFIEKFSSSAGVASDLPLEILRSYSNEAANFLSSMGSYRVNLPSGVHESDFEGATIPTSVIMGQEYDFKFRIPKHLMLDVVELIRRSGSDKFETGTLHDGSHFLTVIDSGKKSLDVKIHLLTRDCLLPVGTKTKIADGKYKFELRHDNVALNVAKLNDTFCAIDADGVVNFNRCCKSSDIVRNDLCVEANLIRLAKRMARAAYICLSDDLSEQMKYVSDCKIIDLPIIVENFQSMSAYFTTRYEDDMTLSMFGCYHTVGEFVDALSSFVKNQTPENAGTLCDLLDPTIKTVLGNFLYITVDPILGEYEKIVDDVCQGFVSFYQRPQIVADLNAMGAEFTLEKDLWDLLKSNILATLNTY